MSAIDPRELGDKALLSYLLFGDLPRPGWPGRRRSMTLRMIQVAGLTFVMCAVLVAVLAAIVLVWAMSLPVPR